MKTAKRPARLGKQKKMPVDLPEDNRTVKEILQGIVDRLPDNATWDDVMYKVYVCTNIAEGLRDEKEGRFLTEEEVFRDLDQ